MNEIGIYLYSPPPINTIDIIFYMSMTVISLIHNTKNEIIVWPYIKMLNIPIWGYWYSYESPCFFFSQPLHLSLPIFIAGKRILIYLFVL